MKTIVLARVCVISARNEVSINQTPAGRSKTSHRGVELVYLVPREIPPACEQSGSCPNLSATLHRSLWEQGNYTQNVSRTTETNPEKPPTFWNIATSESNLSVIIKKKFIYMGYWLSVRSRKLNISQVLFFAGIWNETESRSINTRKKERVRYPVILTGQAWSIKHLLYGFLGYFSCGA